ncbi:DMT family transporter [uncultured Cohaesibacter sp.]|uniref:DMT family transporter n=1 Tax=uncultured Cohaesibacter sp. TaxID=1002546 RepID=UPI002931834B|nr:DMT family transporter [uncultured Cohaesibacter sp.]
MSFLNSPRNLGIFLAIAATLFFACMDAMSKMLVTSHSVWFIMMVRYWFHLGVAVIWALLSKEGFRAAVSTPKPWLQIMRGFLLVAEIALIIYAYSMLGLAEVTTIIMFHPLVVTALAAVFLGEHVGWHRIGASLVGLVGLAIIMQPSGNIWGYGGFVALVATSTFAVYQLFTRLASRYDTTLTSFFYAGLIGVILTTYPGIMKMPAISEINWLLLAGICVFSTAAHFSVMKALSLTEASAIQPYTYMQIVWSIPIGFLVFGALPIWSTILGATLIVGAGLYSIHRATRPGAVD